jgi:hypothetical protein
VSGDQRSTRFRPRRQPKKAPAIEACQGRSVHRLTKPSQTETLARSPALSSGLKRSARFVHHNRKGIPVVGRPGVRESHGAEQGRSSEGVGGSWTVMASGVVQDVIQNLYPHDFERCRALFISRLSPSGFAGLLVTLPLVQSSPQYRMYPVPARDARLLFAPDPTAVCARARASFGT